MILAKISTTKRRGEMMTTGERFVGSSNNSTRRAGKNRRIKRRDHLCAKEDKRA